MVFDLKNSTVCAKADTKGGELVSLIGADGVEHIWGGDPAYWSGRNPILFPIIGALKDGKTILKGKSYAMARHGFARRSEFTAVETGADHVVFELCENEETLRQYPYRFALRVTHSLVENGFSTTVAVQNRDDEPMPFCLGGHTAFRCPLREGERFEEYELHFDKMETASSLRLNAEGNLMHGERFPVLENTQTYALDHRVFDERDTLIFDALASRGVELRHRGSGHGVRIEFADYPMFAVWTKPKGNAPYICLEPWQGCAAVDNESGRFEDKPCCYILQPGQEKCFSYTVRVL